MIATAMLAALAFAQSNGSISGTVKDSKGGVVAGAAVAVINRAQGLRQETQTNGVGDFAFLQLPPGIYDLSVEASGFKKKENSNVTLPVAWPDCKSRGATVVVKIACPNWLAADSVAATSTPRTVT